MCETLLACSILIDADIMSGEEYCMHLDELYEKDPDNDFFLRLKRCSSDVQESISLIREHYKNKDIDYNVFGVFLIRTLETVVLSTEKWPIQPIE